MTTFDYQVGRMGWTGDYNDANTFLDMYTSAENGNNQTGWSNPKYTEFMAKANKETDADKRIKLLQSAEAVAMSEFPAAPIYDYTTLFVSKDHVKNMAPDLLSNINLKAVKIDK